MRGEVLAVGVRCRRVAAPGLVEGGGLRLGEVGREVGNRRVGRHVLPHPHLRGVALAHKVRPQRLLAQPSTAAPALRRPERRDVAGGEERQLGLDEVRPVYVNFLEQFVECSLWQQMRDVLMCGEVLAVGVRSRRVAAPGLVEGGGLRLGEVGREVDRRRVRRHVLPHPHLRGVAQIFKPPFKPV